MSQNFDGWLENALDRGFAALSSRPVPSEPRYRAAQRGSLGWAAAGRRRFLMPLLATAMLAGGGTAAAATGTNPVVLGQQISEGVVACKDQLGRGQQDIAECISEIVLAHRSAVEIAPTVLEPAFVKRAAPSPALPESAVRQTRGIEPVKVVQPARDEREPGESHGSDISDVARSAPPGRELGEAVSTAAWSNRPAGGPDGPRADDADGRSNRPGSSGKNAESSGLSNEPAVQGRGQSASNGNRGNGTGGDPAIADPTDTPTTDARPGNSGVAPSQGRGPNR